MFPCVFAVQSQGAMKLTGTVDVWAEMDKRGQFDLKYVNMHVNYASTGCNYFAVSVTELVRSPAVLLSLPY